jgi:hypothetical protein
MALPTNFSNAYEDVYDVFGGRDATNDLVMQFKGMGLSDSDIVGIFAPYRPATVQAPAAQPPAAQPPAAQPPAAQPPAAQPPAAVETPAVQTPAAVEIPAAKTTDIVDDYIASIPESTMTVEDLYTTILGRPSDAGGKAFWENAFGPTVDESEKADFLQAAKAELATKTKEEQTALAPNLVGTTQTTADTTQVAAVEPEIVLTPEQIKEIEEGLKDIDFLGLKPANQGLGGPLFTIAPPEVQNAVDLKNGTYLTTTGTIVNASGNVLADTGSAATTTLTQQILGQGLTDKWQGQGHGSAQANAADMAKILTGIGITDIKQFGEVPLLAPVEEIGKTYNGNQVVKIDLGDGEIRNAVYQSTGQFDSDGNGIGQYVPIPKDAKIETLYGVSNGESYDAVDTSKVKIVDGKPVVDTGQKTFGNKETGQAVPNTYSERQTGNAFGGTFAGKGNTGYRVQFAPDGTPIFYTTGASSNDLANLMADLGPIGQIGLAIATGGLSIPQQIAANLAVNVLSGKDLGDSIKSAAISFAGAQIPGMDFMSDGASFIKDLGLSTELTNTLTNSFQNAAVSAGTALLSGQDVGEAMTRGFVTGGVNGAVNSLLGNIEGFGDLTANQKKMVTNAVTGVISGKPLDQIVINTAISAANSAIADAKGTTGSLDTNTEDTLTKAGLVDGNAATDADTITSLLANKDVVSSIGSDAVTTPDTLNLGGADALAKTLTDASTLIDTEFGDLKGAQDRNAANDQLRDTIKTSSSFNDAYALARKELGANKTFDWLNPKTGKVESFSTATKEERPDLNITAGDKALDALNASNLSTVTDASSTVAAQGDTAARRAAADKLSGLDNQSSAEIRRLTALNNSLVLGNAPNQSTAETARLAAQNRTAKLSAEESDSAITSVFKNVTGTVSGALGEQASALEGTLKASGAIGKNSLLAGMANGLTSYGANNVSTKAQDQEQGFITEIAKAGNTGNFWPDAGAKLKALPSAIINNPIGFGYTVVKEGIQEVIPILTGASAAKWGGKLIGFAANSIVNGIEAGGAGYNGTVAKAEKAGMSEEAAHAAGQKAFVATATVAAVLGPIVDAPFIKRAAGDVVQKTTLGTVGKSAAKEMPLEYVEEGGAQGFEDYFATGKVNVNNILTGATAGMAVAGHTVASIQLGEMALSKVEQAASSEILNSVAGDKAGDLQTQVASTLANTKNLSDAGTQIAATMQDAGMNPAQAQSVANTVVAEAVVHNLTKNGSEDTKFSVDNLNAPVGFDTDGNAVTVGDVLGSSVTGKGTDFKVQPDVVIGTASDGKPLTIGDLTGLQAKETAITTDAKATAAAVDAKSDVVTTLETAGLSETKTEGEAKDDVVTTLETAGLTDTKDGTLESVISDTTAADAKTKADADAQAVTDAKTKADADAQAVTDAKTKADADAQAVTDAKTKADADAQAVADAKTKADADAKAAADAQAKIDADVKAAADAQAKIDADIKAAADAKTKADADAQAAADAKTKADADAQAAVDAKTKADADAQAATDAKTKADADAQAAVDAKTKADADAAAAKTKADAKAAADAQAKADADAKAAANAQAKADADAKAAADAKTKADADAKAAADAQAKIDAEVKAAADAQAKADADVKAATDAQTKADADTKAAADAQAKIDAEVKAAADAQAKIDAEVKAAADAQAKIDAEVKTEPDVISELETAGLTETKPDIISELKTEPEVKEEIKTEPEVKEEVKTEPEVKEEVKTEPEVKKEVKTEPEVKTETKVTTDLPNIKDAEKVIDDLDDDVIDKVTTLLDDPIIDKIISDPTKQPPPKPPKNPKDPSKQTGLTWPQATALAGSFGVPQLANVFYYGKEFGAKKQKVGKSGKLDQEEYKALSVTKAGAEGEKIEEEALAQKGKTDENDIEELLKKIEGSSDNAATPEEIEQIVRQGA